MLTARPFATAELASRLRRRGYEPAEIDVAVARLTAVGLLDDAEYARRLTRSKVVGGSASARRVRQELAARGVGRAVADQAVSEVLRDEGVDETAAAERIARRRLAALTGLDRVTQRRRLFAYLARRGYELEDVRRAVDTVLADEG